MTFGMSSLRYSHGQIAVVNWSREYVLRPINQNEYRKGGINRCYIMCEPNHSFLVKRMAERSISIQLSMELITKSGILAVVGHRMINQESSILV